MRPRVLVAGALAAGALLALPAGAGAAAVSVSADPSLYPPFHLGTPDYTVRCDPGTPVRFSISAQQGTRVAVGNRQPRSGSFKASVSLAPSRAVVLRFIDSSGTTTHYVRCLPSDFPSWKTEVDGAPTTRWFVVTPSRNGVDTGYIAVFDAHGVPVWWMKGDPPPFNGELLPDGNLAWTRWVFTRPPLGRYEEFALDGHLVRTYDTSPKGSNPHELRVLPDGSYLMVAYRPRDHVDLSRWGGPSDTMVLDGELQQRDASGKVLWRWSTRGHVALSETKHWYPKLFKDKPVDLGNGHFAYDIVHANSIEAVGSDRVLVSLRHTDGVYMLDKATGKVLWKLGGTHRAESLRIVGDPYGSDELGGQHDARALDGGKTITVYDNGTLRNRPPRALAFHVDAANGTAKLVESVGFDRVSTSTCCGSARRLPDGHWVVSWGNNPYVGELTGSGRTLLTLHFGGDKVSYRAEPVLAGRLSRSALRTGMDSVAGR